MDVNDRINVVISIASSLTEVGKISRGTIRSRSVSCPVTDLALWEGREIVMGADQVMFGAYTPINDRRYPFGSVALRVDEKHLDLFGDGHKAVIAVLLAFRGTHPEIAVQVATRDDEVHSGPLDVVLQGLLDRRDAEAREIHQKLEVFCDEMEELSDRERELARELEDLQYQKDTAREEMRDLIGDLDDMGVDTDDLGANDWI